MMGIAALAVSGGDANLGVINAITTPTTSRWCHCPKGPWRCCASACRAPKRRPAFIKGFRGLYP
jgi:hypothetical protein